MTCMSSVPPHLGSGLASSLSPNTHKPRKTFDSDNRLALNLSFEGTGTRVISDNESDEGSSFTSEEDVNIGDSDTGTDLRGSQELELQVLSLEPESKTSSNIDDIDPDRNLFGTKKTWSSDYISLDRLQQRLSDASANNANLTIIHINCRSVIYKIPEISDIINKTHPDIIALTETWLEENLLDTIHIPEYKFVGKARESGRGGGIAFFISNQLNFEIYVPFNDDLDLATFEHLFLKIKLKCSELMIGVIYRPPGQGLDLFLQEFDKLILHIESKSKDIILTGDFNIDLLKVNDHHETNIFYNSLIAHHFLPTITKPTRLTQTSKTLIDNLFCTNWSRLLMASIILSDISDHLPILAQFSSVKYRKKEQIKSERRSITSAGLDKFSNDLKGKTGS